MQMMQSILQLYSLMTQPHSGNSVMKLRFVQFSGAEQEGVHWKHP